MINIQPHHQLFVAGLFQITSKDANNCYSITVATTIASLTMRQSFNHIITMGQFKRILFFASDLFVIFEAEHKKEFSLCKRPMNDSCTLFALIDNWKNKWENNKTINFESVIYQLQADESTALEIWNLWRMSVGEGWSHVQHLGEKSA